MATRLLLTYPNSDGSIVTLTRLWRDDPAELNVMDLGDYADGSAVDLFDVAIPDDEDTANAAFRAQALKNLEYVCAAVNAAESIAEGVPTDDEWGSAASFMEYVAGALDLAKVPRPDHYEK